jgi:nucleotide-binding universal stress UspA family protein
LHWWQDGSAISPSAVRDGEGRERQKETGMNEEPEAKTPDEPEASSAEESQSVGRVFLVVVDESPEMEVALRFACRRARHTGGRVALLYVTEPSEFQNWLAVGDLMRDEARSQAEQVLQKLASQVTDMVGSMPILFLREGQKRDQLLKLLEEEPSISILVLGASTSQGGPGPLVSALTGKFIGRLSIPVTIVPDSLLEEQIDAIT